jgi:hypothetical protein
MLPDRKLGNVSASRVDAHLNDERRWKTDRSDVGYEVLVRWNGVNATPVRYRALDVSDGGMRIKSMLPLREGAMGTVLSTLPHSALVNRAFTIVWCRKSSEVDRNGVAFEAGLRFDA